MLNYTSLRIYIETAKRQNKWKTTTLVTLRLATLGKGETKGKKRV